MIQASTQLWLLFLYDLPDKRGFVTILRSFDVPLCMGTHMLAFAAKHAQHALNDTVEQPEQCVDFGLMQVCQGSLHLLAPCLLNGVNQFAAARRGYHHNLPPVAFVPGTYDQLLFQQAVYYSG
jgi:hypothetical protein